MLKFEIKKYFSKTVNKLILIVVLLVAVGYSFLAAESMRDRKSTRLNSSHS